MMMIITIIIIINLYGVNGAHTFLYCFVSDLLSVADLEFSREVSLIISLSKYKFSNFYPNTVFLYPSVTATENTKILIERSD